MTLKQASTVHADRFAFNIYLHNGQKKPDLKLSFIRVLDMHWDNTHLILDDGTAWEVYAEPKVVDAMRTEETVRCIVSFQVFHNGDQIAVARLYRQQQENKDIKSCHP